jgi:transcriptional regulator with XRE-family HTH domain
MRLSAEKIKGLCVERGLQLGDLLSQAGVSRTAYYSLVRKGTVLPRSVGAIAGALGIAPLEILDQTSGPERRVRDLLEELERIMARHRRASREDVWHTLLLLDEKPIERLRRGLLRGRRPDLH